MDEILRLLPEILNIDLIRGTISNPRDKEGIIKIRVRPLEKKGELYFQLESFTKTQAFHENLTAKDACRKIAGYMERFGQMQIETVREECTVLVSKKGKVTVRRKKRKTEARPADRSHNRKKHYILEEGVPVPFLRDLGVMTEDGKIVRTKTDKFRQINRFLEFIEDILPRLEKGRELTILDFGCGKSYLTFAMYHYLHELRGYDIRIIGLDLKKDVIDHCGKLAEKYGYDKLTFLVGDIADYDGVDRVDMVVTLHACDTATDYALATDGLRAKYLEREGYETQVLEFIDMEHTPKNILLRAVKTGRKDGRAAEEIRKCIEFLGAAPTLGRLLDHKGENE